MIDVVVTQTGFAGETVTLDVEDGGRIVGSQEVKLPVDGEPAAVRVRFTASEAGPRLFTFRIAPRPGEMVTQNNQREALIDVLDRREKILYFEGEPRPEMKFLRRAVEDDKNLQVATLQRTADNKYFRVGVDNENELAAGFPENARRAVRLPRHHPGQHRGGRVHRRPAADDCRVRRAPGRRSADAGRSALVQPRAVMPARRLLTRCRSSSNGCRRSARPTAGRASEDPPDPRRRSARHHADRGHGSGILHAVESDARADQRQPAARPQAGRDRAAQRDRREPRRPQPVLAFQRYGRGKALAFAVQDSWLWQMHASMPLEDMTHENFWRQLLRWVVDGVPDAGRHAHADRARRSGRARHADRRGRRQVLRRAQRRARGRPRQGSAGNGRRRADAVDRRQERRVPRARSPPRPTASMPPTSKRRATASRSAPASMHLRAAPGDAEYFDATMHAARLKRIAEETGGSSTPPTTCRAAGGSEVHRPRRDDGRGTRPLAHADRAAGDRRPDGGRVGLSPRGRDGLGIGVRVEGRVGSRCGTQASQ